eukprot:Awhi_evm2s2064
MWITSTVFIFVTWLILYGVAFYSLLWVLTIFEEINDLNHKDTVQDYASSKDNLDYGFRAGIDVT